MALSADNYDLLKNPINLAYAVNCSVDGEELHVGAFFLEDRIPNSPIRLESGEDSVRIHLPDELLNQSDSWRGWDLTFEIAD